MANRKLPFGYCMTGGQICTAETEAEIVRMIFASYGAGNSYKTLAGWLNDSVVPYLAGKQWNKNALARILQDKRYLGDTTYPPILTADEFDRIKPNNSGKLEHPQLKTIRILARCAHCGDIVQRKGKDHWNCPHCTVPALDTTDKRLMDDVAELLRGLCEHPDTVTIPPASDDVEHELVLNAQSALSHEMDRADFDEPVAKAKAVALAAARFDTLGSEDYETMRIQYILKKAEQTGGLDTDLLRQITSDILIHAGGEVSLKLKNGQVIGKDGFI